MPAPSSPGLSRRVRLRLLALVPLPLLLVVMADLTGILSAGDSRIECPAGTALVMGAAQYDGRPSPAFERRLERALDLHESGCVDRIIVSGGSRAGDRYSEGQTGVNWLLDHGVPAGGLLAEEHATSSWQNVRNSLPLIEGGLVIVTDDLHAFRSNWVARQHGLDAQLATVPAGGSRLGYLGRELVGLLGYQLGLAR